MTYSYNASSVMLINKKKMISPEGTYPVLGRSMGYRFGAFSGISSGILDEIIT